MASSPQVHLQSRCRGGVRPDKNPPAFPLVCLLCDQSAVLLKFLGGTSAGWEELLDNPTVGILIKLRSLSRIWPTARLYKTKVPV